MICVCKYILFFAASDIAGEWRDYPGGQNPNDGKTDVLNENKIELMKLKKWFKLLIPIK